MHIYCLNKGQLLLLEFTPLFTINDDEYYPSYVDTSFSLQVLNIFIINGLYILKLLKENFFTFNSAVL